MYNRYRQGVAFFVGIGFSIFLALLPLSASLAISPADVPNPQQTSGTWVADMADLLSPVSESQLNRMISGLEAENGTEIAVVTVQNTDSAQSPKSFATDLFNEWGIGKASVNNGVLFLVSKDDRRTELEIGYGLEDTISNEQASQLLRSVVTPKFKEGNFDAGILQGTETLVAILSGEQAAPSVKPERDYSWVNPVLVLLGLFGVSFMCDRLGGNNRRNHNGYYHDNHYSSHHHSSGGGGFGGSDFGGGGSDGGGGGDSW